jgi:hypothetical protein
MKKKRCLISIIFDEPFWQPIWYKYYSQFFSDEDIYVLGNPEKDPLMQNTPFNVVPFQPEHFLDVWACKEAVMNLQRRMCDEYDLVVFAEADEFFIPDPDKYRDFGDWMDKFTGQYVRPMGYDVTHDVENEPPYDPSKPILSQRKWYVHIPHMSRTVITRQPILWYSEGFHQSNPEGPIDPDLKNFHMHKFDYNLCLERHKQRLKWKAHPDAVRLNLGAYILITEDTELRKWFYSDLHRGRELIPEKYGNCI